MLKAIKYLQTEQVMHKLRIFKKSISYSCVKFVFVSLNILMKKVFMLKMKGLQKRYMHITFTAQKYKDEIPLRLYFW